MWGVPQSSQVWQLTTTTHRTKENTILMTSFIIKDKNQYQPNEETHRASSGIVSDTELLCPLSMESGCVILQHISVITNQKAPLNCGAQSLYWGYILKIDWIIGPMTQLNLQLSSIPNGWAGSKPHAHNHKDGLSGEQPPSWVISSSRINSGMNSGAQDEQRYSYYWGISKEFSPRNQGQRPNYLRHNTFLCLHCTPVKFSTALNFHARASATRQGEVSKAGPSGTPLLLGWCQGANGSWTSIPFWTCILYSKTVTVCKSRRLNEIQVSQHITPSV